MRPVAHPRNQRWFAGIAALLLAGPAAAGDPDAGREMGLSLRASLKGAAVVSRAPHDPALFPEDSSATSFWRFRLDGEGRPRPWTTFALAYEQRLRVASQGAGSENLGGPIPLEGPAPYRIRQLDWALADRPGFAWRHEIDRASAVFELPYAKLTLGRQAVGWGRGVLFGAVDLFAPFTPLEADREWRRGVDAVRAELRLSDRTSAEVVTAFGESIDASVFAARVRGYAGKADGELVAGWRARDLFAGVTSSAAVGDAEIHGELCLFRAPTAISGGGAWGNDRLAPKAVLGGSYRLAMGRGLVVFAEYHYSGFGVREPEDLIPLLANPDFRARFLRGDSQILGRHAVALLGSIELSNELSVQVLGLASPVDGSGVLSPSATFTLSDAASVQANLYLPWGAKPDGLVLRSEYGATPLSLFVQARIYR
jgi:hypothetical protein